MPETADVDEEFITADLLQCLEKQESLYELHTHLMGMGNASFWVHNILTDRAKLPTQQDFKNYPNIRLHLGPLVWDKEGRKFIDREVTRNFFDGMINSQDLELLRASITYDAALENLISEMFVQKLKYRELTFENDFSYDMVLLLDDLAKGFGIKENQERDMIQAMVEEKLGIHTRKDWEKPFFKDWIIFNARKQKLQIAYGIQAENLRMLIGGTKPIDELTDPAQRDARSHIINAFSMMNADGREPCSADFHSFRGAFTPEFFPRRFALKDSIYTQRLDLLALLLKNALHRFSTCLPPVKYCEFSVGCGDLTRPWVFDVLSTFSKNSSFTAKFKTLVDNGQFPWLKMDDQTQNIEYRFLAGFNRRILRISNAYLPDEAVTLLFEMPHHAIHLMLTEFHRADKKRPTNLFKEQVEQLHRMKEETKSNQSFFDLVVGLDLFGDELGYPYCPFIAHEFLQFIQDAREKNSNFGVRIHCAENVPFIRPNLSGYCLFAAHMYIVYRCLDFLKRKLKSNIRVGHGIAFDKILSIENYKFRKSSVLVAEMQQNARTILPSIPFEVNITSNFYLLGDAIRNTKM
ncbi:unnamed protein product [Rotaria sordida]|uniref:Adenosine deaminase domain-containing protein n=1 Tax=Rotaria sordida TaxID=392033 RepID=A0A814U8W0_9BILA|nr:unnamed protein product [Rotaria sordida]